MKFGIVGDIHANLEALTVTLDLFVEKQVDKIFCVGDIIGYNANPGECIDLLLENDAICISGNHDRFVSGEIDAIIRDETRHVIDFTKKALNKEQMDFISALPEEIYWEDIFAFVHGSPRHKDEYINTLQVAKSNLQFLQRERPFVSICFYGHTHLPYVISNNYIETDIHQSTTFELNRHQTYLINVGSVGQPRDQCPLSSCAIFDTQTYEIHYYRSEYDIPTTQQKVLDAGLSEKIAARLAKGR
jgi:predicted phosphodiesterase